MDHAIFSLAGLLGLVGGCQSTFTSRAGVTKDGLILRDSFEPAVASGPLHDWMIDQSATTKSLVSFVAARHGQGLRLTATQGSVRVYRRIDARNLRSKRLTLSAYAHVNSSVAGESEVRIAALPAERMMDGWDVAKGVVDRRDGWSHVAAALDVPADAVSIELSLVVSGGADVIFDDLQVTSGQPIKDAREMLSTEQKNVLLTTINTLGYLRFFYPSDDAAQLDWRAIETSAVADVLAARRSALVPADLEDLVHRIAPEAVLYTGSRVDSFPAQRALKADSPATHWIHLGFGGGEPFYSFRTGLGEPAEVGMRISAHKPLSDVGACTEASITLTLGSKVTGTATAVLEVSALGSSVQAPPLAVPVHELNATATLHVPDDAYGLSFGVFVTGAGQVDIAGIDLTCAGHVARVISPDTQLIIGGVANFLYKLTRNEQCGPLTCLSIRRQPEMTFAGGNTLDVEVGQGVRLRMPLQLPVVAGHTMPRRDPIAAEPLLPASSTASRLAAVLDMWIVLHWFYPYFGDRGIVWDAALEPALDAAAMARSSDEQRAALTSLAVLLRDDHARVLRDDIDDGLLPVQFRAFDGKVVVTAALASVTDVPVGTRLIALNGVAAGEALRQAARAISSATSAWALKQSAYSLSYGHKGMFANATFQSPDGGAEFIRQLPYVDRGELGPKLRELHPETGSDVAPDIMYVDLHTLDSVTWKSVLPKLAHARAIIFDLRGYVGPAAFSTLGYLSERETRSPTFLVPIVSPIGTQRYEDISWVTAPRKPTLRGKLIFLADARTASAPETILQIVRGEHLGVIVGESTGGTNGNAIVYRTIGGMLFRFTGLRALNHDGSPIQGFGITPDIIVHPTAAGIAAGRDEVLQEAIRFAQKTQ